MASGQAAGIPERRERLTRRAHRDGHQAWRVSRLGMASVVLATVSAGCALTGPEIIGNGRGAYNEAVADTNNQQMLMVAIRDRYEERSSLLAVTSITANVTFSADARIEAGFGDKDNYEGNLTPFSGGVLYEENPTITYTPVEGADYIRQLTAPVPLSGLAMLCRAAIDPTGIYMTLVSSVNGIYNPDFPRSPADVDKRFARFAAIMAELSRAHRLNWVERTKEPGHYSIVIDNYVPDYVDEVGELMRLLGLPEPDGASDRVVVPVSLAHDGREVGGIGITTRSVYKLVELLAAGIEVPPEDLTAGLTVAYPQPGPAGRDIRIRYSDSEPDGAYVAVRYQGGWFYIADNDLITKRFFRVLGTLWGVAIAENAAKISAPVLTVPVSR